MKLPKLFLFAVLVALGAAANALALDYDKLVGYWSDEVGEVIEVRRSGPEAIAHMRSKRGLTSWSNGTIKIKDDTIVLKKQKNGKVINEQTGTYRKDAVVKIRWSNGHVWKHITESDAKELLKKN